MNELVEVALPVPLFRTFTYAVPSTVRHPIVVGSRVVVPFHGRPHIGICVAAGGSLPDGVAPKSISEAPDASPVVSAEMIALCRWMAEYYALPIGVALRAVLPVALTGVAKPSPNPKTHRVAVVRAEMPSLVERDRVFQRAPKQRAVFEMLEARGGRVPAAAILQQVGTTGSTLTTLAKRGLIDLIDEEVDRDPFATRGRVPAASHVPTDAQRAAIEALVAAGPGDVFLLHGITGSGKTLVYLDYLRHVVTVQGKTAIVLVPEIALTPQTVDRFRAVFGDQIAVLHSALSDGERYDAWRALRAGTKRIAVGARSAIFAPLDNLGAIIVDEEHEGSYKSGESPRYHAREVAIVRARLAGAVTVLGSATPSLESWANAQNGKYRYLQLPARVGGAKLPTVDVVDMRRPSGPTHEDPFRYVVSEPLERALHETFARGEQAIVLLNRRGHSAFVQCAACGFVATCPHCSISLTYHTAPPRLVCHYCQHQESDTPVCRQCGGTTLKRRGLGTQQVERLLADRFPLARIARMDVDTTSGKWAHAEILDRVGRGEVDLLLGTQMIAKGLDFPNVTLVGVIDADVGINLPDFRASERCFQLMSQVAGRAGRGPKGGRVIIQTRVPMHHAVRCAVTHDYEAFVHAEIAGRITPPYPPRLRIANVVFSGPHEEETAKYATEGAEWLRRLIESHHIDSVTVVGAAPCPIERIKNRWRWHVLLKAERPAELTLIAQYFVRRFRPPPQRDMRLALDRDPVALL